MAIERESYEKLIDYIESEISEGKLAVGDRLPPERELSALLDISRPTVRMGLTVLEALGIVANRHGSGNYIADDFDHNLVQVMSMMYNLDNMSSEEIRGFRYAAELQAVMLAPGNITDTQRKILQNYIDIMLNSTNEEERIHCDKMIHRTIVEASGNRLVIANYLALSKLLDRYIRSARQSVKQRRPEDFDEFQNTHKRLVDAVCTGDYDIARKALDDHFVYLENDIET